MAGINTQLLAIILAHIVLKISSLVACFKSFFLLQHSCSCNFSFEEIELERVGLELNRNQLVKRGLV